MLRSRILDAVATGEIEALRMPIEWNETIPIFARGPEQPKAFSDAIEMLKKRSFDGKGRETLRILAALFEQPYVKVTRGPVVTYVWPAFAYHQQAPDDPDARLALLRSARFANVVAADDAPLPRVERIGIGADGTWHFFWSG